MLVIEMVKRSKGKLSGQTRKLRGKSKVSIANTVRSFKIGEKIRICPKAKREGLPHLRYRNRYGVVVEKRGKSYVVEIQDYKKKKQLIVGSIHLKLAS
ncbi:50S ribosomal protein L21e [Candidatus Micrarchaeota archaeon]|nr:50S ribosomal protein L21e [Candidatus Micrarchaeota archaeon]